ncbi:G protein [Mount Mabu Lophuromys virus 2]|uniref:G protein n=1 Tax=Mount Mabu Lophuromys virus 2 TaxID=2116560 RepID=A0A2P1GJ88_9MONO|nr:G protein [Mount Mabu Lophuromys virus 2]AVM86026.1 G protein [Mount Mabu Lophuromys virus 2]
MIMNPINTQMTNYYGVGGNKDREAIQTSSTNSTCHSALTYTSMIVGLLSLFTLIALNVTNITYLIGSGGSMNAIKEKQESLGALVRDSVSLTTEEIKPKVDLINNIVSYSIPSQLTQIQHTIKNEVLRQCGPSFVYNNTVCPVVENPSHSQHFKMINPYTISECANTGSFIQVKSHISFIDYPSFIPGSTRKGGCVRIPSFSLSDTIFAYAHNIIAQGCQDSSQSDQYLSIGRIEDHGTDIPVIETIAEWYLNDGLNRKSCSVASGDTYAIMGCTIVTSDERTDYLNPGIGRLSITYLDVFGRKKEWIFTQEEIELDREYLALYFSVGSGVIIDDEIYFLVYGDLAEPMPGNVFCHAPGCAAVNQDVCNAATKPNWFGRHQIVNGILSFTADFESRPRLRVRTIPPSKTWLGAEGRLMYSTVARKTYIYVRSTGWHALAQTGIIDLTGDLSIQWVDQLVLSRPGTSGCPAANRCPKECVTGVYTDAFPLGVNYDVSVSVVLATQSTRSNPRLMVVNGTNIIYVKTVTSASQKASYTTTTCFVFKMRIWCLSIIELSPGAVGEFVPVPFLYQLNLGCVDKDTGVTEQLSSYSGKDTYTLTPYETPKTECYLELSGDDMYFAVKVFGNHQSYRLTWKAQAKTTEDIATVSQLCHEVLKYMTDRGDVFNNNTVVDTEHVTLTPVTLSAGTRVTLTKTDSTPVANETTSMSTAIKATLDRTTRSVTTRLTESTAFNHTSSVLNQITVTPTSSTTEANHTSTPITRVSQHETSSVVTHGQLNNTLNATGSWRLRYSNLFERGYSEMMKWWGNNGD